MKRIPTIPGWLAVLFMLFLLAWTVYDHLAEPCVVGPGVSRIAPDNIETAMYKMGPYYQYKLEGDTLSVNCSDGRGWMRLRY